MNDTHPRGMKMPVPGHIHNQRSARFCHSQCGNVVRGVDGGGRNRSARLGIVRREGCGVFVDEHAHQAAIHELQNPLTARGDVVRVPVVPLDGGLEQTHVGDPFKVACKSTESKRRPARRRATMAGDSAAWPPS